MSGDEFIIKTKKNQAFIEVQPIPAVTPKTNTRARKSTSKPPRSTHKGFCLTTFGISKDVFDLAAQHSQEVIHLLIGFLSLNCLL